MCLCPKCMTASYYRKIRMMYLARFITITHFMMMGVVVKGLQMPVYWFQNASLRLQMCWKTECTMHGSPLSAITCAKRAS